MATGQIFALLERKMSINQPSLRENEHYSTTNLLSIKFVQNNLEHFIDPDKQNRDFSMGRKVRVWTSYRYTENNFSRSWRQNKVNTTEDILKRPCHKKFI